MFTGGQCSLPFFLFFLLHFVFLTDSHPPTRLARSAGIVGIATMASRVLGLVRDQVLAFYFGAGDAMDAFLVAFGRGCDECGVRAHLHQAPRR